MSDLTAILVMLATFGLMIICMVLLMTRGHQRMDEIVSGVANGVPITTKYRWLLLFYDFWGYVLVGTILLMILQLGSTKRLKLQPIQALEPLLTFAQSHAP